MNQSLLGWNGGGPGILAGIPGPPGRAQIGVDARSKARNARSKARNARYRNGGSALRASSRACSSNQTPARGFTIPQSGSKARCCAAGTFHGL